jgi:putative membrane protein
VRTFAARIRTDHGSLAASLGDLASRLDMVAEDDPAGTALRDASVARRDALGALRGPAFDMAYVDVELQSHRELLRVIDEVLLPSTRGGELREYVAALRPVEMAHVAHAEQLRATLEARRSR